MNRLNLATAKVIARALRRTGPRDERQMGPHLALRHPDGRSVTISIKSRTLDSFVLILVLRQATFTIDAFRK